MIFGVTYYSKLHIPISFCYQYDFLPSKDANVPNNQFDLLLVLKKMRCTVNNYKLLRNSK